MKKISLLLVCLLALLWVACELNPPDYIGVWKDSTTLASVFTTVTFDLSADEGTITIDKPVGFDDVVVTGTLAKDGSTLTATITQITVGTTPYTGPALAGFLSGYGLTPVNAFTYSVVRATLTETLAIKGNLILALTGGATDNLTATR